MMFLQAGIDIRATDRLSKTFLYLASRHGYTKIVRILLKKRADVNCHYDLGKNSLRSVLAVACAKDYEDIVRLLIDSGADVN